MGRFRYRAYIDGLRGLSVFVVVMFHCGVQQFREGFLGVDVFFVLSGYLITSIILCEIDLKETIDLIRFYARRARRILPAATVAVLSLSILDRYFDPVSSFSHRKCLISAASYWANFCFIWESTDYWAQDQAEIPVKHYWSLSIEEQYYFVYPFLLLTIVVVFKIFWRRVFGKGNAVKNETEETRTRVDRERYRSHIILICLSMVTICSLMFQIYFVLNRSMTESHMNTLGRWYQLAAGGILGLVLHRKTIICDNNEKRVRICRIYRWLNLTSFALMLVIMLYPVLFSSIPSFHPSFSGLLMTLIVVSLIYFMECESCALDGVELANGTGRFSPQLTRKFLCHYSVVFMGKISYSMYLWHFPFITFGDRLMFLPKNEDRASSQILRCIIVMGGSLILSLISYFVVEKTFMRIRIDKKLVKCLMASMGIIIPVASVLSIRFLIIPDSCGLHGRNEYLNLNYTINLTEINEDTHVVSRVMLFGDSHGKRVSPLFERLRDDIGISYRGFWSAGFPPFTWPGVEEEYEHRWNMFLEAKEYVRETNPDLIMVYCHGIQTCRVNNHICKGKHGADEWRNEFSIPLSKKLVKFLNEFLGGEENKDRKPSRVYVYPKPTPMVLGEKEIPTQCVNRLMATGEYHDGDCDIPAEYNRLRQPVVVSLEEERKILGEKKMEVIVLDHIMCPKGVCHAMSRGTFLFQDHHHVTSDFWLAHADMVFQEFKKHNIIFVNEEAKQEILNFQNSFF